MESFLKLYFGNALARNRVIITLMYLIAMFLVVNKILNWFHITYAFPKEISVASVFDFIISAQVLFPLAGIIVYQGVNELLAYLIAGPLYQRYKFILFRTMADKNMIQTIESELMKNKFVTWSFTKDFKAGPLQRGNAFHHFETYMKTMFWDDFNLGTYRKLSANAMFAVVLSFGLYMKSNPVLIIAFILSIIGWIVFFLAYWQFARQSEYREIYELMYFNLVNPDQTREIYPVSTWNKYFKKYEAWEKKHYLKKRYRKWHEIRKKKMQDFVN